MNARSYNFPQHFLRHARHSLRQHHLPRIERCLRALGEKDIWWRTHGTSNSVGNLVLHLAGNVRQWIVSGLGGAPDRRDRDREFRERGPIPRRVLLRHLRKTVGEVCRVLSALSPPELAGSHTIQGFRVTGLEAVGHVVEHFAYHTGQIIYVTKMKRRRDLGFTRLPKEKPRKRRAANLPAL